MRPQRTPTLRVIHDIALHHWRNGFLVALRSFEQLHHTFHRRSTVSQLDTRHRFAGQYGYPPLFTYATCKYGSFGFRIRISSIAAFLVCIVDHSLAWVCFTVCTQHHWQRTVDELHSFHNSWPLSTSTRALFEPRSTS